MTRRRVALVVVVLVVLIVGVVYNAEQPMYRGPLGAVAVPSAAPSFAAVRLDASPTENLYTAATLSPTADPSLLAVLPVKLDYDARATEAGMTDDVFALAIGGAHVGKGAIVASVARVKPGIDRRSWTEEYDREAPQGVATLHFECDGLWIDEMYADVPKPKADCG